MKVVHLTEEQVKAKISELEVLLPSLAGSKSKRLRTYARLASLNKSLTDPALRKDPEEPKKKKPRKPRRPRKARVRPEHGKHLTAVCLACKETGHLMRFCPTFTNKEKTCYKCGETDHTAKTCKAEGFKFAVCFYCGKQGHLAAYCETKEHKGIYINGGQCHKCGSVYHLAKHCTEAKNITEDLLEKED